MAKRVYQPKVQPIAVQIHIQRAIIVQCETALAEMQKLHKLAAERGVGFMGAPATPAKVAEYEALVRRREREVTEAQERLATLEAQAAA